MFLAGCSEPKGRGAIFGSADGARWDLVYQEETKDKAYTFFDFLQVDGMTVAVGGGRRHVQERSRPAPGLSGWDGLGRPLLQVRFLRPVPLRRRGERAGSSPTAAAGMSPASPTPPTAQPGPTRTRIGCPATAASSRW